MSRLACVRYAHIHSLCELTARITAHSCEVVNGSWPHITSLVLSATQSVSETIRFARSNAYLMVPWKELISSWIVTSSSSALEAVADVHVHGFGALAEHDVAQIAGASLAGLT